MKELTSYEKNLSSETFSREEMILLNKGLHYALQNPTNFENIVVDIKTAIKYDSDSKKDDVRDEVVQLINQQKCVNHHRNNKEGKTLRVLKQKEVFYLKADKGSSLVILVVQNPKLARLYGLPKTHKPGNKMHPITEKTYKFFSRIF